MALSVVNHPWFDEAFYKTGSFISCDNGKSLLLLKGGKFHCGEHDRANKRPSIFCKDFFSHKFYQHISEQAIKLELSDLQKHIKQVSGEVKLTVSSQEEEIFKRDFDQLFQSLGESIQKVVLVSRETFTTSDPIKLRQHLFAQALSMKNARPYGMWYKGRGLIGATPETLFEVIDQELRTEALAGTARLGEEVALMSSHKDRTEHEFVVQDIMEGLKKIGLAPQKSEMTVTAFSKIIHLRTKISAHIHNPISAFELSRILSPTAALGGYPRKASREFLLKTHYHQKYPVRFFGSVIGSDSVGPVGLVMIRNVQWDRNTSWIESGVGIVPESKLEKELAEIQLKRHSVREHYL